MDVTWLNHSNWGNLCHSSSVSGANSHTIFTNINVNNDSFITSASSTNCPNIYLNAYRPEFHETAAACRLLNPRIEINARAQITKP